MEIGIDDIFDDDEDYGLEENTTTQDTEQEIEQQEEINQPKETNDRDILSEFLKSKGIEDLTKIKYEGEDGEEEEISWDSLDQSEKLTILHQLNSNPEVDLDESEIQLINTIRNSKMSPEEYINYVFQRNLEEYTQNNQQNIRQYAIDEYTDDELFVADLIAKMGDDNITKEEAQEALDRAKSNASLFTKQVNAIRNSYKQKEDEEAQYEQYMYQQEQEERFNQFATAVAEQVENFNDFPGFELNMDQDDKEELYEFITGFDEAGNSIFGKALNEPETLVKMAWFALNGEQMLDDISTYVKQQVAKVRKDSYQKGVEDTKAGKVKNAKPVTVYKTNSQPTNNHTSIDDLDW